MKNLINGCVFVLAAGVGLFAQGMPQGQATQGQQAPAQQPQPPMVRTASIAGRVVDADTGEAVGGATVRLQMRTLAQATNGGRGGRGAAPLSAAEMAASQGQVFAIADSDGRFVFHSLPKGPAQLQATATGYIERAAAGAPAARPLQITDDGQHIDGHQLRLVKSASIAGAIVDEAGEPLVGVTVRAMRRDVPAGVPTYALVANARTDDRGFYRLDGLTPGQYFVLLPQTQTTMPAANLEKNTDMIGGLLGANNPLIEAITGSNQSLISGGGVRVGDQVWQTAGGLGGLGTSAPPPPVNGRVAAYQTTFFPGVSQMSQAMAVPLRSGESRTGVDWQVRPTGVARVMGALTSPVGPAANVQIRLVNAPGGSDDDALPVASATTAADGSFAFVGVPIGNYVAKAQQSARGGTSMNGVPAELMASLPAEAMSMLSQRMGGSNDALYLSAPVGVGDKDVMGLALALRPGAKVIGRATFEGTTPAPTAQQLQNVQVSLARSGGGAASVFSQPSRLGADATFKTGTYPAGNYTVSVAGIPGGWMLKSVTVGGRDATVVGFELGDTDLGDVVVTMTDRVSSIAGTVLAVGNQPLPNTTVVMIPADYRTWLSNGAPVRGQVLSGAQTSGAFNLPRVSPGDYLLAAVPDESLAVDHDAPFYEALARVATRVTVAEGEKKSIDLRLVGVVR